MCAKKTQFCNRVCRLPELVLRSHVLDQTRESYRTLPLTRSESVSLFLHTEEAPPGGFHSPRQKQAPDTFLPSGCNRAWQDQTATRHRGDWPQPNHLTDKKQIRSEKGKDLFTSGGSSGGWGTRHPQIRIQRPFSKRISPRKIVIHQVDLLFCLCRKRPPLQCVRIAPERLLLPLF